MLKQSGGYKWFPSLLIGLTAGVASGLLGVGGGIVMVPLLTLFIGLSQHQAHATSLAAIIPIAAIGVLAYMAAGEVDYSIAAFLGVGTLLGAPVGAKIMSKITEGRLETLFGLFMLLVAVRLMWQ